MQLVGYTDADWADNAVDLRSTSGYALSLSILLYVDDLFITNADLDEIDCVKL